MFLFLVAASFSRRPQIVRQIHPVIANDDSPSCKTCKTIIAIIKPLVDAGYADKAITELLKTTCKIFRGSARAQCDEIAEVYVPVIVDLIRKELDNNKICQQIGMCSHDEKNAEVPLLEVNSGKCDVCKIAVKVIKVAVDQGLADHAIKEALHATCNIMSGSARTTCKQIADAYLPVIIGYIRQNLKPEEVCGKISFCSVAPSRNIRTLPLFLEDEDFENVDACSVCKTVIKIIQIAVERGLAEKAIQKAVHAACALIPNQEAKEWCIDIADAYIPTIISWIEQKLSHEEICQKLGMCPVSENKFHIKPRRKNPIRPIKTLPADLKFDEVDGTLCQVCQDFLAWAKQELKVISVDALWKLVQNECPKVKYLSTFCKLINKQNIQTFVDLILNAIPFDKACALVHAC